MKKLMKGIAFGTLAAAVIFAVLFRFYHAGVFLSLAITAGTVCYHVAVRLLTGLAYDLFMGNRADLEKPRYEIKPWESALYRRLRVKDWKGGIPTFDPDVFDPQKHSWDEIAQATCQAERVHETSAVLSFLPMLAGIWFGSIGVFAVTSVIAAAIDMIFVIVKRYNRPRIVRIAERERGDTRTRSE